MGRQGVHCCNTGGGSTAYNFFAEYSGTLPLGNLFVRIKSTSIEVFKFILVVFGYYNENINTM